MKPLILIPLFLVSLQTFSQEKDIPCVKFREGAIVWYLPSSGQQFQSLPAYIPGFVHIRQSLFIHKLSNAQVTANLKDELTALTGTSMSAFQKKEFLEKYACLILMNYQDVGSLQHEFYEKAKDLKSDTDQTIRSNAELVVKMFEMYFEGVRE